MTKKVVDLEKTKRRLKRHVMKTATHDISMTFRCGFSNKKEQIAAVQETRDILNGSNGDLMEVAKVLSSQREKYRQLGCDGYCMTKAAGKL